MLLSAFIRVATFGGARFIIFGTNVDWDPPCLLAGEEAVQVSIDKAGSVGALTIRCGALNVCYGGSFADAVTRAGGDVSGLRGSNVSLRRLAQLLLLASVVRPQAKPLLLQLRVRVGQLLDDVVLLS